MRNGENEREKNPKERERIDIIVAGIIFKAEKLIWSCYSVLYIKRSTVATSKKKKKKNGESVCLEN